MEKPVQAEKEMTRQIPSSIRGCDVERKKVAKTMGAVPRKAAINSIEPVP